MNNRIKKCAALLVIAAMGWGVWAEESAAPAAPSNPPAGEMPSGNASSGESRRGRHRGMPPGMQRLREQYPAEMAEIEKLRETDPEAARSRMRELFAKAGFPERRMGPPGMASGGEISEDVLAKLKEKFPEEFAEYEKLKAQDAEAAQKKLRELLDKAGFGPERRAENQEAVSARDRHRRMLDMVKAELAKRYPERYAAIEAKWKTDPDGARRDFRALFAEAKIDIEGGLGTLEYDYADETKKNSRGGTSGNGFPGGFGPPPGGFGPPPGMGGR